MAFALLWALLGPAPRAAAVGSAGEQTPHEIGADGATCSGAVPSAPERSRVGSHGVLAALRPLDAAAARAPSAERPSSVVGGAAPALARWRLAHSTATSSP